MRMKWFAKLSLQTIPKGLTQPNLARADWATARAGSLPFFMREAGDLTVAGLRSAHGL
jgi:hypothetical protein